MSPRAFKECTRCQQTKASREFEPRARICMQCKRDQVVAEASAPTHEQWQAQVVQLAHMLQWEHLHVRRALGKGRRMVTPTNVDGWPDLFLWKRAMGGAGIELKVPGDYPRQDQLDVLTSLRRAGFATCVAYPDDLDRLTEVLRGRSPGWEYVGKLRS